MYRILFHIGNFPVHTYGVMLIIAFLVALVVARKRAVKYGINPNKLSDMAFILLISGVLGARILFLIQEPPADPKEYYSLQFAGLTSFGGLIGGAIALVWWCLRTKTSIRTVLDVMGPPLLIGHAIGRVGCLLNGCCYGGVCDTSFPFGVHISPTNTHLFHPAQIYDSLMNLAGLAILLVIEKRGVLKLGQVFALAIVAHGVSRFIYEFWRAGTEAQVKAELASSTYWGNLPITQAQAAAGVIVLLGLILFGVYARKARTDPVPPPPTITPEPMSS